MCGICGVVGFEDKRLLKRMCKVLSHRGPDDEGYFIDENVMLGHRRLSIIDVKGGKQPIHNEDESIWIVFNGEIYNFLALRRELEERGHSFYTRSDTEVILHAYEEFGEECVNRLRGMFAFAIWDSEKKKLFLARDRLGKKPLYYSFFNGALFFASEIKAILQYPDMPRRVNTEALDQYLTFQYVPAPLTMFDGIYKLLPGHTLTFKSGRILVKKYWDIEMEPVAAPEDYFAKRLRQILEQAVKIRLMSEVPLGAYLSGGIDSSSVVALMSRYSEEPVKTISVGFGEPDDELKYARVVAEHFETDHREIIVQASAAELLPKIIWHLDEPLADAAVVPTYLMSREAKKHVTVILTGDGSDEIFAGYPHYRTLPRMEKHRKVVPLLIKRILTPLSRALPYIGNGRPNRYLQYISAPDLTELYFRFNAVYEEYEKEKLYTEELKEKTKNVKKPREIVGPYLENRTGDLMNRLLLYDIKVLLPDDFLMKVDKNTMAWSVEARSPFLDHNLVEFSATLPPYLKMNNGVEKYILKKAMKDILPKVTVKRKKRGFNVPINVWLDGELRELAAQVLSKENLKKHGFFEYDTVEKILKRSTKNRYDYANQVWSLLVFQMWYERYIEG